MQLRGVSISQHAPCSRSKARYTIMSIWSSKNSASNTSIGMSLSPPSMVHFRATTLIDSARALPSVAWFIRMRHTVRGPIRYFPITLLHRMSLTVASLVCMRRLYSQILQKGVALQVQCVHLASVAGSLFSCRTLLVSSTVRSLTKIGELEISRTPDSQNSDNWPKEFTTVTERALAFAAALNSLWQRVESSCINKSKFLSKRDRSWCFARYTFAVRPKSDLLRACMSQIRTHRWPNQSFSGA